MAISLSNILVMDTWSISSELATNILVQGNLWIYVSVFLEKYLQMELLVQRVNVCLFFLKKRKGVDFGLSFPL